MSTWRDMEGRLQEYSVARPGTGGFWANVAIVRPWVKVFAGIGFVGIQLLLWLVAFPASKPDSNMPLALKIVLPVLSGIALVAIVLLYGYVYADAKRRGMRYVMWTLLAILIPDLIGVILYFLLRDPLASPCPKCGQVARGSFTFCPNCGCELLRVCRVCRKKLEPGWANCAYCGTPLAAVSNPSAPPAPPAPATQP